jgi:hypothetical protein
MEFAEIKNNFENKSIQKRINFMEIYDFEKDIENREYFINFIKNSQKSENIWYMMWMIDLAGLMEVRDVNLLNQYLEYLLHPNYYLLKLTVLDYVTYTYRLYTADKIDYSAIKYVLENKHDRIIVKNEALLTLILLFPKEKGKYMFQLKKNLLKISDYRSHVRIYNFFLNRDIDEIIPNSFIKELIEISKSKNFGRAVQCSILEVEDMLAQFSVGI